MKYLKKSSIQAACALLLWVSMLALPLELRAQGGDLSELLRRAQNAGIAQSSLQELQNRAGQQGLSDAQLAQLIEPAVSLAEQQLPSDALFSKAFEGLSKGVAPNRILPVLQQLRTHTERIAPTVDGWMKGNESVALLLQDEEMTPEAFRNEMIQSVSRGFNNRVPEATVSRLLERIGDPEIMKNTTARNVLTAVGIFGDLPTSEGRPDMSEALIMRSLKAGFSTSELQKLPAAMSIAQQRSQLPAASVVEGVASQMNNGVPAQEILRNLFNGNIGGGPPGGTPPGLDNRPDKDRGQGKGHNGG